MWFITVPRFYFITASGHWRQKKTDTMKKLMSIVMLLAVTAALHAQKSVTQFLGIPVDGTKSEMIRKLKAKGFESAPYDKEVLEGEFNGYDVNISVVTNNNKVYRIFIIDANPTNEAQIKIRFNNLCDQFFYNLKYTSSGDQKISEDEDISYEMAVKSKTYDAIFFQILPEDGIESETKANAILSQKYTPEQLANPTEEIKNDITSINFDTYAEIRSNNCPNRIVWFRILESYGQYRIGMYYDNVYNQADGSDL